MRDGPILDGPMVDVPISNDPMVDHLVMDGVVVNDGAAGGARSVSTRGRAGFPKPFADVALRSSGVLQGEVVSGDGRAPAADVAGLPVAVIRGRQTVAKTKTDGQGRFALENLTGGVYRVVVDTADGPYWRVLRAWTADGAPPCATSRLRIVVGRLVRGQSPIPSSGFPHAAKIAAIAAGAIAPPIIYHTVTKDGHIPASP
jgi:hypothetical protein